MESLYVVLILIKLNQYLLYDNFQSFKDFFGSEILPSDTIARLPRFTTMF